jgi:hypothetical protein
MIKKTYYSIFILAFLYIFVNIFISAKFWSEARASVNAIPYQIGLTKVVITKCVTTGYPPICTGGMLCSVKDAATCSLYSDIEGTPAGGMGMNALLLDSMMMIAGLTPGGDLIAGGMGPTMMDSGVVASWGGCSGSACAKSDKYSKILASLNRANKFILALVE